MKQALLTLADVQAGHPFRGSVPFVKDGNAFALQMRDLSPNGDIAWDGLIRTEVDANKPVQWLRPGDVVFVARGSRNYAVSVRDVPKPTVCSPHVFLLRIKSPTVLPAFLAWQINRAPAQRYLASNAEGSDQLSIRRPVLEAMPLAVPPLAEQQLIVALADAAAHEEQQYQALIRNRQQQLDALAHALLSSSESLSEPTP
ncbi:restriction endonuclease subunit S [Hydrogenophaga sp. BPS33]|uniref:restriction endonuclease subunit S n=1 Tax=Hydrogenophaga sp. BPS33 TaxID=2651974 RepID=UPI00131FD897|nr:restriction endonuclease subunit S [Hydrogenophaga sp. BPS33]QHE83448.1 restriction endonuclease subunit S [Hydrogenophaga sp. BPS33]